MHSFSRVVLGAKSVGFELKEDQGIWYTRMTDESISLFLDRQQAKGAIRGLKESSEASHFLRDREYLKLRKEHKENLNSVFPKSEEQFKRDKEARNKFLSARVGVPATKRPRRKSVQQSADTRSLLQTKREWIQQ